MNLEKLIAENMLRFGAKNLTEADIQYVKNRILEGAIDPVSFTFKFPLGQYKLEQVGNANIAKLYKDLTEICSNIRVAKLDDIQTTITLNASATTSRINPDSQTYKEGITDNDKLAAARLATLETLIRECIKNYIPMMTDELITAKFKFIKKSAVGTTTDITATITQTGKAPAGAPLSCQSKDQNFSGIQGPKENGYIGYAFDSLASFTVGDTINLTFDPKKVPDCFWIKMEGETEYLSGFLGDAMHNDGYFVKALAAIPDLMKTINTKIKQLGGTAQLTNTTIKPGVLQGGTLKFPSFVKKPFKDRLKIVCFSPLKGTEFTVTVNCVSSKDSTPLGPPTITQIQEKIASASDAALGPLRKKEVIYQETRKGNIKYVVYPSADGSGGATGKYLQTAKENVFTKGMNPLPEPGTDITEYVNSITFKDLRPENTLYPDKDEWLSKK